MISIIIPVHNEKESIEQILLNLQRKFKEDYEVIVIDDNSSDGSFEIMEKLSLPFPEFKIIVNKYRKGFAESLEIGINMAKGDIIVPVMSDGSDEIDIIPRMCKGISRGCDIICASRYMRRGKRKNSFFLKTILSRYFNYLIHAITKIPTLDSTNPFKAYRKTIFENIKIKSKGFEISMEVVLKAYFYGYKIAEIPTVWEERRFGRSHFSIFKDSFKFLRVFISTSIIQ